MAGYSYISDTTKYLLAVEEAEELGIDLKLHRTREKPGSGLAWLAIASWPNEKQAQELWLAGDEDHLEEPPEAPDYFGFGATPGTAAWSAVEKICDGG